MRRPIHLGLVGEGLEVYRAHSIYMHACNQNRQHGSCTSRVGVARKRLLVRIRAGEVRHLSRTCVEAVPNDWVLSVTPPAYCRSPAVDGTCLASNRGHGTHGRQDDQTFQRSQRPWQANNLNIPPFSDNRYGRTRQQLGMVDCTLGANQEDR